MVGGGIPAKSPNSFGGDYHREDPPNREPVNVMSIVSISGYWVHLTKAYDNPRWMIDSSTIGRARRLPPPQGIKNNAGAFCEEDLACGDSFYL